MRPAQVASGPATTGLGAGAAGTTIGAASATWGRVGEDDSSCADGLAGAACNTGADDGLGVGAVTAGRVETDCLWAGGRLGDGTVACGVGAAGADAEADAIGDGDGDDVASDGETASAAAGATAGAPVASATGSGADAADCGDATPPGRKPKATAAPTTATTARPISTGKTRDRDAAAARTGAGGADGTVGSVDKVRAADFGAGAGRSRGGMTIVAV